MSHETTVTKFSSPVSVFLIIKQNQVRKYYFNSEKSSFLEVRPAFNSSIPGDFEERIFISLTKIMRDRGYNQTFYTNISEILDNLNVPRSTKNGLYKKTKESIDKMANSTYRFKNLFYSNKYRPLFLLSNRELYDLMPRENIGIVNRISTPSVYNISLKFTLK